LDCRCPVGFNLDEAVAWAGASGFDMAGHFRSRWLRAGRRLRLDKGYGVKAEHGPGAARGEIAQHFPGSSVEQGGAVRVDELGDLVLWPILRYSHQTDYMNLRRVMRLFVGGRHKLQAERELVPFGVVSGAGDVHLGTQHRLRARSTVPVGIHIDLREEVPFKLQR
jgi:hypothetical protein